MNDQELIECIAQNAVREAYGVAEDFTYTTPYDAAYDTMRAIRRTLTLLRHDLKGKGEPENKVLEASIKEIRKLADRITETHEQMENYKYTTLQELRRKLREEMV